MIERPKSLIMPHPRALAWPAAFQRLRGGSIAPATLSFRGFLAWFAACFLLTFLLVWAYVAWMPMAFLSRDYPMWIAKQTMLSECRPDAVAVFGDSRAVAGIVPDVMQLRVSNFAMSGSSPIETYFAVQRALRCPDPPRLVVIAHSAVKYTDDADFWVFSARTGFLSHKEISDVEADAIRLQDPQLDDARGGLRLPPWLRDTLFATHFPPLYFASLVDGFVGLRWWHNRAALQAALISHGQALFGKSPGCASLADEARNEPFRVMPLTDLYFTRTLALLAQHHVPLVVLTMPINQATFRMVSPQLGVRFDRYLRDKTAGLPNVLVADARLPCWPDNAFGDAWHFNQQGADAYSRLLDGRLRALLAGSDDRASLDRCM